VEILGEERQGAPVLVRANAAGAVAVDELREILRIFAREYGVSEPRGFT
jgi:hypothetical protein